MCPNLGECWGSGTATFLMLGDVCTRTCAFCDIKHGKPALLDWGEAERVAQAVKAMELKHAVITSVNRDERRDGGSPIFAMVIRRIRELLPGCSIEVLIPDFKGSIEALKIVMKPQLAGIERADSIALDLHKWLHIPFEAGCVIVRSETKHRHTFSLTPEYLAHETRGLAAGHWFSDYGLQLSRQFRALKVWMSIKEHGLDRFGRMIARNVEQAHYFGRLVEQDPNLELLAPIGMNRSLHRDGHLNDIETLLQQNR